MRISLLFSLLLAMFMIPALSAADGSYWVFLGTGSNKSKGIYRVEFDSATGKLGKVEVAAEAVNPGFLAIHPKNTHLFAVGSITNAEGKKVDGVMSFTLDAKTGELKAINQQPSIGGGPCHINCDREAKHVLVANYGGGSTTVLPFDTDGKLSVASSFVQHKGTSVDKGRQSAPHAHSVNLDAAGKFAMVADLGLDKVLVYKYDSATGKISPNDPPSVDTPPGGGPRHFAFHPSGKFAYVINETTLSMTAFSYDAAKGALTEIHTVSTLPAADGPGPKPGWSTAEVVAHPGGKFIYGSNRGHDTIAVFSVAADGKITLVQNAPAEVKTPRNFNLDPTGKWLFTEGQGSDTIALFKVDLATGKLTATGTKLEVGVPVCMKFLPLK